MNRKMIFLFAAITAAAPINSAPAADVEFGGTVNATCAIVVTQDGILAARQNARILTSGGRGARHGRATVTATSSNFRLFVDQPTKFENKPTADSTPVQDFRARIRSTGATQFRWTRNSQALNPGASNVRIQFRARKAPGVSFANGNYSAIVVIRCE